MAKLPGKTAYAGIRRTTTRKSGFNSHPDSTGGEFKMEAATGLQLSPNTPLLIKFIFPNPKDNTYIGFGGFYRSDKPVKVEIDNPNTNKNTISNYPLPNTSKFGSMWSSELGNTSVTVSIISQKPTTIYLHNMECGLIWHDAFDSAKENGQEGYLQNMHTIMPEAGFYTESGEIQITNDIVSDSEDFFELKSCNRCARFLPINTHNEREHLSFSNHCVAKAPCIHKGFGILTDIESGELIDLHFGFQLECRFCKKYFVNMPLNWQRTAAQMKEDGQRRRNFELLIAEIYQSSPQLSYRLKTGRELLDDIWKRFKGECFNCKSVLESKRKMHIDHTRPLALLWPLDETATALCPSCNTRKRDRTPSQFYTKEQLIDLSKIVGLSEDELMEPEPNHNVIAELLKRLDWFFDEFLTKPELLKERDGKITAELVVKALDKVLSRSQSTKYEFSFVGEYNKRRDGNLKFDENEDLNSVI